MFRHFYNARGEYVYMLLQRSLIMIWVFALGISSFGQAAPVQAAPKGEVLNIYRMDIYTPQDPICAHRTYQVRVRVILSTWQIVDRVVMQESHAGVGQAGITATVLGSDIAEPIPSMKPVMTGWVASGKKRPGEAIFQLVTKKAGTATLFFDAQRADGGWHSTETEINVVHCKKKVKMSYLMRQSSGGATGLVIGQMDTLLEGDGDTYQGTAILDSDRTTTVPGCSLSFSGFENPATIIGKATGSPGNEQLELTIDYEAAPSSMTATCPIVGTITTNTTEDPTNWLATNATFSATGGVQSFPINFAQWFGRLIIIVEPEESAGS